jgi:hypothetical protein
MLFGLFLIHIDCVPLELVNSAALLFEVNKTAMEGDKNSISNFNHHNTNEGSVEKA